MSSLVDLAGLAAVGALSLSGLAPLCSWWTVAILAASQCCRPLVSRCTAPATAPGPPQHSLPRHRRPGKAARSSPGRVALACACAAAGFWCICVMFGAPAEELHAETLLMSCLLTALTALPAGLSGGVAGMLALLSPGDRDGRPERTGVALTLFGAWCGGAAIPLDWDRPWQKWPTPCFVGALVGFAASRVLLRRRSSAEADDRPDVSEKI